MRYINLKLTYLLNVRYIIDLLISSKLMLQKAKILQGLTQVHIQIGIQSCEF